MREIVIVITDLYLSPAPALRDPTAFTDSNSAASALPGLEQIARFGERQGLADGWRAWLARWLGRSDLAQAAPASVAAASVAAAANTMPAVAVAPAAFVAPTASVAPPASVAPAVNQGPPPVQGVAQQSAARAWIATPVHFAAGLTALHFDRRGILRLPRAQLEPLALDFQRSFLDSHLSLAPLDSGDFLLFQPAVPEVRTTEPARIAGADVAAALPNGAGATVLRRLGAELEMWLHEHAVNRERASRNEPPISTLWLWGGGPATLSGASSSHDSASARLPVSAHVAVATPLVAPAPAPASPTASDLPRAFGSDSYLTGLWRLCGSDTRPLPEQIDSAFSYAQSAVVVVEAGQGLRTNESWTLYDALANLDRRFIAPAVEALRRDDVDAVSILANDRRLVLNPRDHFKIWRRPRTGLAGLR